MDPKNVPTGSQTQLQDANNDLARINQEMYKKNLELAERNKTLSLLRKIDEIILSTVTDIREIARQVCTILVNDGEYQTAAIYLLTPDKKHVQLLGYSLAQVILKQSDVLQKSISFKRAFDAADPNLFVMQTLRERVVKTTDNPFEFLDYQRDPNVKADPDFKVNSTLVFPLLIRDQALGVMVVSHKSPVHTLSEYDWDLLQRLVNMIGISLDNAILYSEVQSTNQKLKVLDRLKDEFVSLASHELRTPMTAIKSYLWLFLEDNRAQLSDQQKMYVERAYLSTDRLINLVNDMLNVSRIESGRLIVNKRLIDVVKLIQESIAEVMPTVTEQKKTLTFAPPLSPIPQVNADYDKIKQVLLNLLGNSIKFTPDGGSITVFIKIDGSNVVVSVKDTGKGISLQDMGKLFKKFGIAGSASVLTHGAQSTGLGLYISKSIVTLHEGEIWVESDGENKGSTFSFSLPVAQMGSVEKQQIQDTSSLPLANQQVSSGT